MKVLRAMVLAALLLVLVGDVEARGRKRGGCCGSGGCAVSSCGTVCPVCESKPSTGLYGGEAVEEGGTTTFELSPDGKVMMPAGTITITDSTGRYVYLTPAATTPGGITTYYLFRTGVPVRIVPKK